MRTHARIVHPPDWPHAESARRALEGVDTWLDVRSEIKTEGAPRVDSEDDPRVARKYGILTIHTAEDGRRPDRTLWRIFAPEGYVPSRADIGAPPTRIAGLHWGAPEGLERCPWKTLSAEHLLGHVAHLCDLLCRRGKGAHPRHTVSKQSAWETAHPRRSFTHSLPGVPYSTKTFCLDQKIEQLSFALAEMKYRNLIPSAEEMSGADVAVYWDRESSAGRMPKTLLELALVAARERARKFGQLG